MRFRRPLRALARAWPRGARLLLTLWLLAFSAHHAAPDAPLWYGGGAGHAHRHGLPSSLETADAPAFVAPHDHQHGHCELCFGSTFQLPTILGAALRPNPEFPQRGVVLVSSLTFMDVALPDAHAPPRG